LIFMVQVFCRAIAGGSNRTRPQIDLDHEPSDENDPSIKTLLGENSRA